MKKIIHRLIFLVSFFIIGYLTFAVLSTITMNRIKINGTMYKKLHALNVQ